MIDPSMHLEVEVSMEELNTSFLSHMLSMNSAGQRKRLCVSFAPPMKDICDNKVYSSFIELNSEEILLSSDEILPNQKRIRAYGRFWVHVNVYVGAVQLFETYEVSVSTIRGDIVYLSNEIDGIRMYSSMKNMLACLSLDAIRGHMKVTREDLCDTI